MRSSKGNLFKKIFCLIPIVLLPVSVVAYSQNNQDSSLFGASAGGDSRASKNNIKSQQIPEMYAACNPKSKKCVAVIAKGTEQYKAMYSNDKGKTWFDGQTNRSEGKFILFYAFTCGKDVSHCVAVGETGDHLRVAVALKTIDGGITWQDTNYTGPCHGYEAYAHFSSVKCDKYGLNCIAQGTCLLDSGYYIDFSASV